MRYLVIGGSGLLGSAMARRLSGEVHCTYNRNKLEISGCESLFLDLSDSASAAEAIKSIHPDVVFHAASNPSVDWHEREREAAFALNVVGAQTVAKTTAGIRAKLIYISTSFVFPGGEKVFTEEDFPEPINHYGLTKKLAEDAVRSNPNHLIIRTDQIYGWGSPGQKVSFVQSVLEKFMKGEKAEVCSDWSNCPTYVEDLADASLALVGKGRSGTYHAAGSDFIDRHSWARKIAVAFGFDPSLAVAIQSHGLDLPAKRPNVRLSSAKLLKDSGAAMRGVESGLDAMKASVRMDL
jgi:dTDP-4-dehydrorhamnose reductase